MTAIDFKKRYPRLFQKIIKIYGGRKNIHDPAAAVALWLRKEQPPVCEVCHKPLIITKRYRTADTKNRRCLLHINTSSTIKFKRLLDNLPAHLSIVDNIPEIISASTLLTFECKMHGKYVQSAGYFLKGGGCAKCYFESKKGNVKITKEKWANLSTAVHNGKYQYNSVIYKGTTYNVTIECPTHGKFVQNAGLHVRGHGCKQCASEQLNFINTMDTNEFISRAKLMHGDTYNYASTSYTGSRNHVSIECKTHGLFDQVAYYHLHGNGCQKCGIAKTTYKSAAEYEIIEFLKENGITEIIHSDRHLGFELDIYIPGSKLAIEYNGIYWHSSGSRDSDLRISKQHLIKTEKCEAAGISLLHITDIEWDDLQKKEIWKSTILHKLGLTKNRVYARKCSIVLVSYKSAVGFFEDNHLQGFASSAINIGLQHEGKLVAVGAFSKARFSKDKSAYELLRFASLKGTSVIGGFQKIINEFKKTHQGVLVSYANRRWSQGAVYNASDFQLESTSGPCYYYTDCKKLWHRSVFQKHKLKDLLENFDPSKSEVENMYNNNYRRIWDCGHLVYTLKL